MESAHSDTADRVRKILELPELRWIPDRIARRIESGTPLDRPLSISRATPEQRRAIDDLLGRRSTTGSSVTLDPTRLCETLGVESIELVARICCAESYIKANERLAREKSWNALFNEARRAAADSAPLLAWLDRLERDGLLKRLCANDPEAARQLMRHALSTLDRLPVDEMLLPQLAAAVSGDSHALDPGQPLSTLCLRAIREIHGIDGTRDAESRRYAWEAAGVLLDDLSAPALVFQLAAPADSTLSPILRLHNEQKLPYYLSLRQLRRGARFHPLPDSMETVFVCENPSVIGRAAAELGGNCRALVCTNGQPSTTVMRLLRKLRDAGASLRAHADFDWAGLRIVDQLVRELDAEPWLMTADLYESQMATVGLTGTPFDADWAPNLVARMRKCDKAVYEEQVCDSLLDELRVSWLTTPLKAL